MKKYFIVLNVIFFSFSSFCQQITFQKKYTAPFPNNSINSLYEVIQTANNGYLAGNHNEILKIDSIGNKEWIKLLPNLSANLARSIGCVSKTKKNEYIGCGSPFIFKLDSNYAFEWTKDLNGLTSTGFYSIHETSDNALILGGGTCFCNPVFDNRFLIVKTDSSGVILWSKVYNMPRSDDFGCLALCADKGFILCGTSQSVIDSIHWDISILKVDSVGNSQWAKNYGKLNSESTCEQIIVTSDGGYVLTGYRNLHFYLLKTDASGNILWEKWYQAGNYSTANWVEETTDKGLITVANAEDNITGTACLLMKTDSLGNLEWARRLGAGSGEVWTGCVKLTEDGGYVVGARNGVSNQCIEIIKTDSLGHTNGCLETTPTITVSNLNDTTVNVSVTDSVIIVTSVAVTLVTPLVGSEVTLCAPAGIEETQIEEAEIEIYPNPFTEKLKVKSTKYKDESKIDIVIYDLMGEKVFEKKLSLNKTEEELNLSFLQQGVYFLNVKSKEGNCTKKIVKM